MWLTVLLLGAFNYIANNYKGVRYSKNIISHVLPSSGRGSFPDRVVALNADTNA